MQKFDDMTQSPAIIDHRRSVAQPATSLISTCLITVPVRIPSAHRRCARHRCDVPARASRHADLADASTASPNPCQTESLHLWKAFVIQYLGLIQYSVNRCLFSAPLPVTNRMAPQHPSANKGCNHGDSSAVLEPMRWAH